MRENDRLLMDGQHRLLQRYAPETSVRRIRWSGGETQVLELGSGPPLLLVHGGGDGAYEWVPILVSLARAHQVFAVDRPGHGLADPFSYRGVDLDSHIRLFVGGVLDALELESSDMLANSIGGYWAAIFALAEPPRVSRLVIAGAPPGVTRDAPLPMRAIGLPLIGRQIGRLVMGNPSREGSRKFWGGMLVVHPDRLSDEFLDVDVAHMRRNSTTVLELLRLLIGPRGIRRRFVLGDRWNALDIPTLYLCGELDAFMTSGMKRAWDEIAAANPRVSIKRVPGAGHLPWMDEPDLVVAEVESFLTAS